MQLELRYTGGVEATDSLRAHIERRLGFALGRFQNKINRVSLHLSDENGPRGGIDIRCKIHTHLQPHGAIFVEQDASNPESAVDVATDRLSQAVRRKLDRQRDDRG